MPHARDFPYLDHPGPLALAHKGGAGEHPAENSLAAFEAAVRLGYRYVETDVHVTADGVAVAFHDHVLDNVTDRRGVVGELRWDEVRRARIAGLEPIARLDELLASFPGVRVNLDPKHDAAVAPLAEVVRRTASVERVLVGSFSDRRLTRMRRLLGPRLCTSLGPVGVARLVGLANRVPTGRLPAPCVQVPVRYGSVTIVTERLVAAAHRRGMHVHVWTVDDAAEMHGLLDLGVDGIITDRPSVLRDVLRSRGAWHA